MKRAIILSILLCSLAQGANEIRAFCPGATTCFSVVREIDGDVWYVTGDTFEVWGGGAGRTMADYDIALTDKSGDMFVGTMDTDISAGYYYILTFQQAGVNPADTDPAVWQEYGYWTGTVWQPNNMKTIEDKVDTIAVDVAGLDGDVMRGTDGVSLVIPDAAGTAAGLHGITDGLIGGLVVPDAAGTAAGLHGVTDGLITGLVVPDAAGTAAGLHGVTDSLIVDVNDNIEADIAGITVDNGAIADEVVLHMDANSADLNTIAIDVAGLDGSAMIGTNGAITSLDAITTDKDSYKATGFNTVVPDAAGTAAALHTATDSDISDAYDRIGDVETLVTGLNNISTAQVNTEVDNALADYDGPTDTEMVAYFAALNDITVAEIMAAVIEGPITLVKAMRGLISRELGKASGGGTTTVIWRDTQDTKDRVTMTVDTSGNRTGVVTDLD